MDTGIGMNDKPMKSIGICSPAEYVQQEKAVSKLVRRGKLLELIH